MNLRPFGPEIELMFSYFFSCRQCYKKETLQNDMVRHLYYGNYVAFERTYSRESEQAKALGIVVDLEEKLRSMLSEEQKALFKQYDDAVADLASVSNADCFVEGYQLGVNLILAAFPEHVEMLKQILTGADLGGNNQ